MKSILPAALLLLTLALSASACKKDRLEDVKDDLLTLRAQAQCEQSLALVLEVIQEEIAQNPNLNSGLSGLSVGQCPAVSLTQGGFPATLTIDFGNGCLTKKGHQMEGKIVAVVSGKTDTAGTTLKVNLVGLKVDQNAVSGNLNIVTVGGSGSAQQNLNFSAADFVVVTKDGQTVTLKQLSGARTQLEGQSTTPKNAGQTALLDDVFSISFSGSGTDADNKSFTLQTTTPLRREYDCRYIVSGIIEYNVEPAAKKADYGAGTCDNLIEVTVGGVKKSVELP